jgi:AraC family transcriptional regulator
MDWDQEAKMRVAVDMPGSIREPYLQVHGEHGLEMTLGSGSIEAGPRRSEMTRITYNAGEIGLFPRHMEVWVRAADQGRLILNISEEALMATGDGMRGEVELRPKCRLVDARVSSLVAAVNAERIAGFPSGKLFLDSVEQALASALVDRYAVRRPSVPRYRGGLAPARLRRITELVHARIEEELTLQEMAQCAGLSTAHFSQMFRKSTDESPRQFVLRERVERAKEMLCSGEMRVLDVAVACGFKTQQHFARVFRRICGASPTEYRYEVLR